MQSGETHVELKALHRLGRSVSEFGLSRTTVYKELSGPGPRRYGPRERPAALSDEQLIYVDRRLAVCPLIHTPTSTWSCGPSTATRAAIRPSSARATRTPLGTT